MSKPTLVQKALNRPSQTYGNLDTRPKKDYYSTKQDMIRIAAAAAASNTHTTASTKLARSLYYPSPQYQHVDDDDEDDGDSDLEVFFTPNTSPRTSMASSAATITFGGGATRKPSRRSLTNVTSAESHLPMVLPLPLPEQSTSVVKSQTLTEPQTSGSVPSTRTPSRSTSTSTRTPSTSSPATVFRSTSTSTQTRNRHAALSSTSSLSSTSLDAHSIISSEAAEMVVDQSATPKAKDKDKQRETISHSTPTSQPRDERKDRRQAIHIPSTTTSVSSATRPRTDGIGSSTTTTIVIGSSRDAHAHGKGKEREKERERNFASASPSLSTTTPVPSTTSATSTPASSKHNSISYANPISATNTESGTGTISISSRTKYVPPTSSGGGRNGSNKSPHTFSAFAAIGSSSNNSPATSVPGPSASHDHEHSSRSTSTPTSSLSTTTPSPHTLSRKGHIQIGEKNGGESAFSTKTPKTASTASSPKGTNSSANASPSTKTSINNTKASTQSKIPIPADTNGGQAGHKNRSAPSSTRSSDANGHAKSSSTSSPPSAFPNVSTSSPQSTSPPSTVHRKAPPPVLPPLPIISYQTQPQNTHPTPIQKPGSGQSGLMAMFNMDALIEEEEEEEEDLYGGGDEQLDEDEGRSTPRMYNRGQSRPYGSSSSNSPSTHPSTSGDASTSTSGHTRRAPPKTLSAEVTSLQQTFTSPGERPSKGTQGYTSLVLPRAPPPSSSNMYANGVGGKHPKMQVKAIRDGTSGKVDLTKSGVAQTTMASVEVVRGLGERARGKSVFGLLRFGFGGGGKARERERPRGPIPVHIPAAAGNGSAQGDTPIDLSSASANATSITPLGFTAYRAPPSYVPSGSVLVQVWAVGVDGVDGRLVGVKFGNGVSRAALHSGGDETEEEEETEGEGDETGLETETEREGRLPQSSTDDEDWEDNLMSTQSTPARPTQPKVGGIAPRMSPEHTRKGRLAALGRSFSLRIAKGTNNDAAVQRSASAAVPSSKPRAGANGNANESPSHKKALSFSLKRSNTAVSRATNGTAGSSEKSATGTTQPRSQSKKRKSPKQSQATVGYIPGRSFVGRVLECGWEVRDEVVRKGEWVVGLLDVRKGGALAEFIVVDRHRVHRVPQPQAGSASNPVWAMSPSAAPSSPASPFSNQLNSAIAQPNPPPPQTLTLEELALLPLCGLPAYRAVRTFSFAFSSRDGGRGGASAIDRKSLDFVGGNYAHGHGPNQSSVNANKNDDMLAEHGHDPRHGYRRRALVLRGHDGIGAMAVQMLARRGWLVSVHVPCSALPHNASQAEIDRFMQVTEERARLWGADEIIHDDSNPMGGVPASVAGAVSRNEEWEPGADDGRGAAVRLMDMIGEDGDVFDAVLDTVGGKDVREAGERLLRFQGPIGGINNGPGAVTRNGIPVFPRRGLGQFTTTVGDVPERVVPSAGDNFKAGLRSLRLGGTATHATAHSYGNEPYSQATPTTPGVEDGATPRISIDGKAAKGKVGYAWVSVAQDVDWEGDDVSETLGAVVRMALEGGVRPVVEDMRDLGSLEEGTDSGKDLSPSRVVPFEHAPKVFVDNGQLRDGGTIVVRIADY